MFCWINCLIKKCGLPWRFFHLSWHKMQTDVNRRHLSCFEPDCQYAEMSWQLSLRKWVGLDYCFNSINCVQIANLNPSLMLAFDIMMYTLHHFNRCCQSSDCAGVLPRWQFESKQILCLKWYNGDGNRVYRWPACGGGSMTVFWV